MANYLSSRDPTISTQEKQLAFKIRVQMAPIAGNFAAKYNSELCQLGCNTKEDYIHIMKNCKTFINEDILTNEEVLEVFGTNAKKVVHIAKLINKKIEDREKVIKKL